MLLSKIKIKEKFSQSAAQYDQYAGLQHEVRQQLFDRLPAQACQVLDVGTGTGELVAQLAEKFTTAKIVGLDLAPGMIAQAQTKINSANVSFVEGDGEALPFNQAEFDLVVSSLALQWMEPQRAFAEACRVLKPQGRYIFTTFGPATLQQLRQQGLSINHFPAKAELAGWLKPYFSRVEISSAIITKKYQDVFALFKYLKAIGAQNPAELTGQGLMTRRRLSNCFGPGDLSVDFEAYLAVCCKT